MSLHSRFSTERDLLKREVYNNTTAICSVEYWIEEPAFYITKAKEMVRKKWN